MSNQTSKRIALLPVWLWFWLGVYIVSLPNLISYLIYLFQDSVSQYYTWTVELGFEHSFFELLRVVNLYEIAAYIVIFIGVVSIFFPRARGRIIEKNYKLAAHDENAAIQEITAFVRQYIPHIEVRANLLRTDLHAITYPLGFRKPSLGVFGKLVMLWRSDRESAEAILRHEIAHIRQGDILILGAGSLFEKTVSYWVWIFVLLVFIPVLLYTGGSILEVGPYLKELGIFTTSRFLSQVFQLLTSGILAWISEFLLTFSFFILPLAGIWSSELQADRLAAAEIKSDEVMKRTMNLLAQEKGWKWKERIVAGATHPPTSLRRFLTERTTSRGVVLLLMGFYPLMYLVRLLMLLGTFLPSLQIGLGDFVENVSLALNTWTKSFLPVLIAMVVWLFLWRWLEPWWSNLFTSSNNSRKGYVPGGLLLMMFLTLGAGVLAGCSAVGNETVTIYKIGQVFQAGEAQVIVLNWDILTDSPDLQGKVDKKIVRVEVAVRNNGQDSIAPLVSCARLKDGAGKEYYYSLKDEESNVIITRDLPSGAPGPGEKIQGTISFLVDQNADDLQFIFIANPPLDMTRAAVALTNDPAGRITPPETLPVSTPAIPSLNPMLTLEDFTVAVTNVWQIDSETFPPDPGDKLIALDLTIVNTSSEPFKISSIFIFELQDENGITYSPGATATAATGKKLPQDDLAPGEQVSLSIGFKLPETLEQARFQYMFDTSATTELKIP